MAIDAVVADVVTEDGRTYLVLAAAPGATVAGQPRLEVLDPPPGLRGLIGAELWGGSCHLMFGETKIADRVGYSRIRFTGRQQAAGAPPS